MAQGIDYQKFVEGIRTHPTLAHLFASISLELPGAAVYAQAKILEDGSREWISENYREVAAKVYRLSRYLISSGVKPGDKVAIISYTRPEWMIADLAILCAGATSVSIYQSLNIDETGFILLDSGASVVFLENEEQLRKVVALAERTISVAASEDAPAREGRVRITKMITFEETSDHPLRESLYSILTNAQRDASPFPPPGENEVASLVYTSGTSGPPKGVIQTHSNHLANLWQACRSNLFAPSGDIFLFLPLAHSFARLIGYIGFLTPTVAKFPAIPDPTSSSLNAASAMRDLREAGAEVVPIVPRILEKVMVGLEEKISAPGIRGLLLESAVRVRQRVYQSGIEGKKISRKDLIGSLLAAPVIRGIRRQLFGRGFRHAVSGGARLPTEVNHYFAALGIAIFQGYGLTETCVATNVNRIGNNLIGSVGPCLEGVEVKIASDDEILFRGPNIARGYHNRPIATAAAWDSEGWFHTGDLGHVDEKGFLFVDGRKKDLLVTSGGKKVAPQNIEEKLGSSPLIANAVLAGDGKPYCVALIIPEKSAVKHWAEARGLVLGEFLSQSKEFCAEIQTHIDLVNAALSRFETVKKFIIVDDEVSVENGLLTPTLKIKRAVVIKKYADQIERLYADGQKGGE